MRTDEARGRRLTFFFPDGRPRDESTACIVETNVSGSYEYSQRHSMAVPIAGFFKAKT